MIAKYLLVLFVSFLIMDAYQTYDLWQQGGHLVFAWVYATLTALMSVASWHQFKEAIK